MRRLFFCPDKKPDDYINVTIELDDMDITSAETKSTYDEIKKYVAEHNAGMKVSNLYISQVKKNAELKLERICALQRGEWTACRAIRRLPRQTWNLFQVLIMDFSLLSPLEFFVDPKNVDGRNNKPPAMRVRVDCYTKKLPFRVQ